MKRFLIHVDTNWCGEEDTFRAVAESEIELWDIAELTDLRDYIFKNTNL